MFAMDGVLNKIHHGSVQPAHTVLRCLLKGAVYSNLSCPFTSGLLLPLVKCFKFSLGHSAMPFLSKFRVYRSISFCLACREPTCTMAKGDIDLPRQCSWNFPMCLGLMPASLAAHWMMFSRCSLRRSHQFITIILPAASARCFSASW